MAILEIYVSTDVESDGPCPGPNSMLSFASAAFTIDKELISTFSRNLELLPDANPDPKTQRFWDSNQAAWEACRENPDDPTIAMKDYARWVGKIAFNGKPIFMAFPLGYDWKMVDWYFHKLIGENPFGISGLDMKSYAAAMLKKENFSHSVKRNFPKRWFDKLPHTHIALDDAIEQGAMGINMLRENLGLPEIDEIKRLEKSH